MPGYKCCSRQTQTPLSPSRASRTAGRTDGGTASPATGRQGKAWHTAMPGRARLPGQTQHLSAFVDHTAGTGLRLGSPMVPQRGRVRAPVLFTSVRCSRTNAARPPRHCPPKGGEGLRPPRCHVRAQPGSSRHPRSPALDAWPSTLQHSASGQAVSWQHTWLLGDSPILQVTPGPAQGRAPHPDCPVPGPEQRPCKGAAEEQQPSGTSVVPPPAEHYTGPSRRLRRIKVLFSFSFCTGC